MSVQLGDRNVSDSGAVQWECCLQPVKTPGRHIWSHLEPPNLEISPSLSTYAQRLSSLEVRRIHADLTVVPQPFLSYVLPQSYQLAFKGIVHPQIKLLSSCTQPHVSWMTWIILWNTKEVSNLMKMQCCFGPCSDDPTVKGNYFERGGQRLTESH